MTSGRGHEPRKADHLYGVCFNIASVLCFGFFGPQACAILFSQPEIKPEPPALEGKILTTREVPQRGKSLEAGKAGKWLLP